MPKTGLIPHSEEQTGIRIASAAPITFDWTNLTVKNTPPPGKNQGSSSSCTSQATAYAFYNKTGIDISRKDLYSNTYLPGGGAYLVSPGQFLASNGFLKLLNYPDPDPETETNMEEKVVINDNGRIRTFSVNIQIQSVDNIDAIANAIMTHDAAIIGINYQESGFNPSWTHPTYNPANASQNEGHALFCLNPILYNGLHAIDCMSSWYGSVDPSGVVSTHHVLDENFFPFGVFELLTLDIQEITNNMQLVKNNGVIYIQSGVNDIKLLGIADPATLALFGDEPVVDVASLPVAESYTIAQGFIINGK